MKTRRFRRLGALALTVALVAAACSDEDGDSAATATAEPTVIATEEPTAEPTATPEPTVEPTGEPVAPVTSEPTPTPTAEPTATPEPTVEPTGEPVAPVTPEPTPRPTAEPEEPEEEPEDILALHLCGELGPPNGPSGAVARPLPEGSGGTLLWAHEQEPPNLHLEDPNNGLLITEWIRGGMWEGLYGVDSTNEFYPELLAEEAVVTSNDDGSATISYRLRDGLTWSDGTALTSRDVQYTCNASANPDNELITSFEVISDTEFVITLAEFFSGYKGLFNEIYPSHALGDDEETINASLREWVGPDGTTLPSSGPLIFDGWERNNYMRLLRNPLYQGNNSPDAIHRGVTYVDAVRINWVPDTDTQVNALLSDESHLIVAQPQMEFQELVTNEHFEVVSLPGPVYEHWGLNLLNPHLADPAVREALALAMDKAEMMSELYAPLFGDRLPAEGLGNVYWLSNQRYYEDHTSQAGYGQGNVAAARERLEAAGYTLRDGVYEHPERGRLSLRVGTTGGNALREMQQELLQAQYVAAGIEITIDNVPGAAYFSQRPFSLPAIEASISGGEEGDPSVWDIAQFAWVGGPWPGGGSSSFRCGSGTNPYGYCNETFDERSYECDSLIDGDEQGSCYNELNRYLTTLELDPDDGLFMLPLTQKPLFIGYLTSALAQHGLIGEGSQAGPLVNVADFRFR